jgi:EmrB/QacA subfamily drug resistance transporter
MLSISLPKVRITDKWLVMIAVTLGMFMSLMDSTIVNVAIPQMQLGFGADIQAVQWVVTVYMITQAAVIPTAPYLVARFGGKRAYVWTLIAFLLGSILCGVAWNLPSLVLFRLIQGIGGGILLPLVMTLLYQAFPTEERGTAVSAMGIPLMIAPAIGPVLGGYLVTYFGWPWAFFINIPLGIVAVAIAQKALRHTPGEQQTRFDGAGFLTAAAGSATLLYGVSAVTDGDNTTRNVIFLFGGALFLLTFVVIELVKARRGQQPLLDLRRFRDRTFAFSSLANVFVAFSRFGLFFLIPIYLQALRQQTPAEAGTIQTAQALAMLAILPIGGRLADKIGPRPVVIVGLILLTGAVALMATLALNTPIWTIVGILILLGIAFGFVHQIPVSAMSQIEKDEHKEVANGSTLLTVLHATAAPMGVALLSSIVQTRSEQHIINLAGQGINGELLQQQSTLLAMHESFLIASFLILVALAAMCFVPKRRKSMQEQPKHASMGEPNIS